MKAVMVVALLGVLGALGGAGFFMLRRPDAERSHADKRMAWALAVRVGLSIALFLFVLLGWQLGWIAPRGLPVG